MAIIFRTAGAWGPGKGSNLSAAEGDNNFWDLAQRVLDLETDMPEPNNIADILVDGSQMTVVMDNGDTFGPFTLPVATIHWRGAWAADTDYFVNDLVSVAGRGVYLVRVAHHTEPLSEFDSGLLIGSVSAYYLLFTLPGFPTINWKGEYAASILYSMADLFFVTDQGIFLVLKEHTSAIAFDPDAEDAGDPLYFRFVDWATLAEDESDILFLDNVLVATTVDIALTGEQTIDTVLTSASRVLVKSQTNAIENGIYVSAAGAWSRSADADTDAEVVSNIAVYVTDGDVNQFRAFILSTLNPIVLGTTPLFWSRLKLGRPPIRQVREITDADSIVQRIGFNGAYLRFNKATAQTLDFDGADHFQTGRGFSVQRIGAGTVTVSATGVTLSKPGALNLSLIDGATYDFLKVGPSTWIMMGPLDAGAVSASDVANDSGVPGTTVADALDTLLAGGAVYSDEQAQDAVGSILSTSGDRVRFVYDDATPGIHADVHVTAQYRVLGRISSGAGVAEELTPANIHSVISQSPIAVGFQGTTFDNGNMASSFTALIANGNLQKGTNHGTTTFNAPTGSDDFQMTFTIVNDATAGVITLTGFDKTSGDAFDTTNLHSWRLFVTKSAGKIDVSVKALF